MRLIVLTLTLLFLAAPALATVTITAEIDATDNRKIWIKYESDEAELIRAFALDITVTDGNIIDINDYAVGDDNGGYGIFPGSFAAAPIAVNPTTGQVDNWGVAGYSPVAPPGSPDALGGIGTRGVTIEMGSLYDTAAPGHSGILCSVTIDCDVTKICVTANAIRGNVVLESGEEVQNLVLADDVAASCLHYSGGCGHDEFPNTAGYERQYQDWVASGKPLCWLGNIAPEWEYQCDGDAAGDKQVIGWRVYSNDLVRLANSWQKRFGDSGLDPCADFDHKGQVIGWRVYSNDLVILAGNWQKKDTQLPGGCPRPE